MIKIESKHTLFHGTERSRELGVAKINQGLPSGANLARIGTNQNYIYTKGFDSQAGHLVPYSIVEITYLPTLGGGAGEWYASEAFLKMYNAVCGSAYTTTNFSKADLEMHIVIGEGFLTALDTIDRMLDIYALNEYENIAIRNLHQACGFSNTNNSIQFASLVAARNRLVTKYNKLLIPSSIPALDRHRNLCRHIYTDDIHDKTQFIVFRPYVFYTRMNTGMTQVMPSNAWTSVQNMSVYLETFIATLESDLDGYLQSAFFDELSPYLWRAMIDPHGPQISKVYVVEQYNLPLPTLDYTFIYDNEVCQLFRNANFVGLPVNVRNNHTGAAQSHINFFEDSDGVLRQGQLAINTTTYIDGLGISPIGLVYSSTPGTTLYPDAIDAQDLFSNTTITKSVWPCQIGSRYLNLEDFPSSEDSLFTALGGQIFIQKMNSSSKNLYNIRACGDMLFLFFSAWRTNPAFKDGNHENQLHESHLCANYALLDNWYGTAISSNFALNAHTASALADTPMQFAGFFSCPIIYYIGTDFDDMTMLPMMIDIDNIVEVPYEALVTYWTYDAYDRFNLQSEYARSENKSIKSKNKHYKPVSKKPVNDKSGSKAENVK